MNWTEPLFIVTIPFIISGIITYYYLSYRHKEKLELINRGDDIIPQDNLQNKKLRNLGRGIISVSLALGIFVGNILAHYTSLKPVFCYVSMILLFFGLGSLIFYYIIKEN